MRRLVRLGTACGRAAFAASLLCGILAGRALADTNTAPVAWTLDGPVRGLSEVDVQQFRGIRYAAAPLGGLRWRPPTPPARHRDIADASQFGAHCPQAASFFGIASSNEDCLFLNVYAPQGAGDWWGRALPVLVWIHGGALVVGESEDFDPSKMVRQGDVVVVTINYRLGALGYLAQPSLDAEGHRFANYGLMDQQAALRWVQRNIRFFGGDPQRVTLFGQSAGGLSTLSNLASPDSAGLFQRAIPQSGAYSLTLPTLATAEAQGSAFATASGCADQTASCLRALPVATILAHESQNIVPIVDGTVLPNSLGDAFAAGAFNRVPVIQGTTRNEYNLFIGEDFDVLGSGPITASAYPALLDSVFGATDGARVLAHYPLSAYPSPDQAAGAVFTDNAFACPGRRANQLLSAYVPVWAYEFSDPNPPQDFVPPASFPYGAYHESDVQFLMDVRTRPGTKALTPAEERLSRRMIRYWTDFARAGRPNRIDDGDGGVFWSRYGAATDRVQNLAPPRPSPAGDFAAVHQCAFWASIGG